MSDATSQSRRPPNTVVSGKGVHLAPLAAGMDIPGVNGHSYFAQDVLSLPRPIQLANLVSATPQAQSVSSTDTNSPEFLSTGIQLTVVDHKAAASVRPAKPRRRPKNSVKSNKSSYVSRGLVSEQFAKRFKGDDLSDNLVLANYERSLVLLDFGTGGNRIEPLSKLFFAKEWPLCHTLNRRTAGAQQLDVAVGMSSGDLVWFDVASQRYERVNKSCPQRSPAAIVALAWAPLSDSLVAAAHADGQVIVYDVWGGTVTAVYRLAVRPTALAFVGPATLLVANRSGYQQVLDLQGSTGNSGGVREFIPSFFGSVLAAATSPDGRFWASGGHDDAVSVYDTHTKQLVVRLVGHEAWVKSISWDARAEVRGETRVGEPATYTLATLGEDRQVLLWEFTPSLVARVAWHPSVEIAQDEQYAARTHAVGPRGAPVVHGRVMQRAAPQLFPTGRAKPVVVEYGDLVLSSVRMTTTGFVVSSQDGRFLTWKRVSA